MKELTCVMALSHKRRLALLNEKHDACHNRLLANDKHLRYNICSIFLKIRALDEKEHCM
jgi:hypothetical protein